MLLVSGDVDTANTTVESKVDNMVLKLNNLKMALDDYANHSSNELKGIEWQRLFAEINARQGNITKFITYLPELKDNIKSANKLFTEYIATKPASYIDEINDDYLPELEAQRDSYLEQMTSLNEQMTTLSEKIKKPDTVTRTGYNEETGESYSYEVVITDVAALQSQYDSCKTEYDNCKAEYDKFVEWIAFLQQLAPTNDCVRGAVNGLDVVNFVS